MIKRRRLKQQLTLKDRLSAWAHEVREQADKMHPGLDRDMLLKKAKQAETASHLDDWMKSPGLRPPR